MVRSLPLRNGYFSAPRIGPTEEKELIEWARSLVPLLMDDSVEWNFSCEKRGVQICEDRQKGGMVYSVRGLNSMNASLGDVMETLLSSTTSEYRTVMRLLLGDHFMDGAVLYQREFNESESLCIKWVAMKSHSPIALDSDFCFMEYSAIISGETIGAEPGTSIGICLFESLDQPECKSLLESHKLERGWVSRCGYIFTPSTVDPGTLNAQFVCSIRQPSGVRTRRRANRSIVTNWAADSLASIQEAINSRRIGKRLASKIAPKKWVNDDERRCCATCLKAFSKMRRKHHCRVCGEVICSRCSIFNTVDLPSVGLTDVRICKACFEGLGDEPLEARLSSTSTIDTVGETPLALTLPAGSVVPDEVGVAWLRQLAARDPSKKTLVEDFVTNCDTSDAAAAAGSMDTPPDDIYDMLCDLASQALGCKFAVVSLVDENRQWFKSKVNIAEKDIPRDFSFCDYPVQTKAPLVVMDTIADDRFTNNPFVDGPLGIRFLAGAPLFALSGDCVGSVCVLDTEPRSEIPSSQIVLMEKLAHLAMVSMQERREAAEKKQQQIADKLVSHRSFPTPPSSADVAPLPAVSNLKADPSHQEYEAQMMELLQQSYETRQQVDLNKKKTDAINKDIDSLKEQAI